ncbi:hypothetical protein B0H14DRAFT_3139129 [Mycena olivaceomarginata]|nr:hypothetical protein B0H14DRAFT_3139129 [Mycena olivaceomarginata]
MTREQTTCLLIPRSKPAQKNDLSDVLSSPFPIIIPPSSGGLRPSIRCIPRKIPQDYRAIKPRKTVRVLTGDILRCTWGLRFVDPQEFSGTRTFNNGCGPQNSKPTPNELATGQIWNGCHRVERKLDSNPEVLMKPTFGSTYGASAISISTLLTHPWRS